MFELFDPQLDLRIANGAQLPHWYQPGVSYFVTFRTDDSMPEDVRCHWYAQCNDWLLRHGIRADVPGWRQQLGQLDDSKRREFHDTFSRQYLEALDNGYGKCVLSNSEISKIVADSLMHFDGSRYHIGDFVVMPNHVHLTVCLLGRTDIEAQCTSWKRFTANKIHQRLGTSGRFWQEESFDHIIRSPEQFVAIQRYIATNPAHLQAGEFCLYQRPETK